MPSLAASSSQSSNRIALAPIRDSRLNINSPLSLKNKRSYTSSLVDIVGPTTATDSVKRQKVVSAQAQTLKASKSVSFSDFGFGSTPSKSTSLHGTPLVSSDTNATAGLAATKLKLKLQLAFYKLQHRSNNNKKPGNGYIDSTRSHTQTNTSFDSSEIFTKPTSIYPVDRKSHLPTPPKLTGYSSSANINLQTKTRITQNPSNQAKRTTYKSTKKPSLSAIAYDKNVSNFKSTQNLRLFSVKKGSQYYHEVSNVPLVPCDASKTNSVQIVRPNSEIIPRTITSDSSMIKLPKPMVCKVNMESSNMGSQSNHVGLNPMSLPPINKILKTPMKNSLSTRNLVNSYLQDQRQNQPLDLAHTKHDDANHTILNTDETIDDDDDGPLRESTCNSIKVSKKENNNVLSSSPIRNTQNTLGTPNSFSVAKSLLQLGSGFYS